MLQPMATLPKNLQVLLKLKPGIPNRGTSPDPVWMRGRTPDGVAVYGFEDDRYTHKTKDFEGWAPLTTILSHGHSEW